MLIGESTLNVSIRTYKKDKTPRKFCCGRSVFGKTAQYLVQRHGYPCCNPGRLIDLLQRGGINLSTTHHLVLDEADQMLDKGFIHALRRILPYLSKTRQTMLFSATISKQIENQSETNLKIPKTVPINQNP